MMDSIRGLLQGAGDPFDNDPLAIGGALPQEGPVDPRKAEKEPFQSKLDGYPEEFIIRDKQEVLAELLSRFEGADDYRKPYEEIALRNFSLYRTQRREAIEGRSNLHIPRMYEQIDTLRSRIYKSVFSQRPYINFIPKVKATTTLEDYEDSTRKADIASALVDMQLENTGIRAKGYDFITSYLLAPIAILGVGWRYDEKLVKRKQTKTELILDPFGHAMVDEVGNPIIQTRVEVAEQREVAIDDNEVININFFDFWLDPKGECLDTSRYVFHREWLTREDIEEKLIVMTAAHEGEGQAFSVDWDKVGSSDGLEEGREASRDEVGLSGEDDDEKDQRLRMYEVLNYWEDERYSMIINRKELAYDGPNPYWRHSSKPFTIATYEPIPNEVYGMSAAEIVSDLQEEINTHRNQRIDNVALALNKMYSILRDADVDESELVSRPGGVVRVDDHDDIRELRTTDVTSSSYTEEQIVKMDMENTLGVPSVVRGVDSTRQETATEIVTKSSNAGIRFDVKIMLFEAMGLTRLAKLMDMNNQQFIDDDRLIRLVGEEGIEDWRLVGPDEIVGEFDYRPAGPSVDPAANKELRRNQLIQVYELAMRTQNPYFNIYELSKELLESFDLRNTDKLLNSKEEVEQEQMEAMLKQQVMQEQMAAQQAQQGQGLPPEAMVGQAPGGLSEQAMAQALMDASR